MRKNSQTKPKPFTADRWRGIITTIIMLALSVVALVIVVIVLPLNDATRIVLPTATPVADAEEILVIPPPIIDTTGIVVFGGLLILLVLVFVLRELNWFRRNC